MRRLAICLSLLLAAVIPLSAQWTVSGQVKLPPAPGARLPGVLFAPDGWSAVVFLMPRQAAAAAATAPASTPAAIQVAWDRFQPNLIVVPAGATVTFQDRGAKAVPLDLLRRRGQLRFQQRCGFCHGWDGRAQTPVGSSMQPSARNLTSADIQAWSKPHLESVVGAGIPGSGMPRWHRVLGRADLERIVAFVKELPAFDEGALMPPANPQSDAGNGWKLERLPLILPGGTLARRFAQPGIYPLAMETAIAPQPLAFIVAVDSRYAATVGANGHFRFANIPSGQYRLVVWHPGRPALTRHLDVQANTQLTLAIP